MDLPPHNEPGRWTAKTTLSREQRAILDHFQETFGMNHAEAVRHLLMRQLEDWYARVIAPEERRKRESTDQAAS